MELLFGADAVIKNAENFDLEQIFDCGQCFRFDRDTSFDGVRYGGTAFGKHLFIRKSGNDIVLENVSEKDFYNIWYPFFDMDRDYGGIIASIKEPHAKKCAAYGSGIRILRQDKWETICSFIISQNNNIPRIKKIIETVSRSFGTPFSDNGNTYYAFPTAEQLASAGEQAIFDCKTGFRAKYIYDAAKRVASGDFDIAAAEKLDAESLCTELLKIKGVGPKVAACVGLFGFAHYESFPIDVWIKRVINKYYGDGFDPSVFGEYAGICQQYLFYYERSLTDDGK